MCKTHKFVKFDEDRIFCEKCGMFMVAARQAPAYVPDWRYYPPYIVQPWPPTYPFGTFIWNDTGSITTVSDNSGGGVTYSLAGVLNG